MKIEDEQPAQPLNPQLNPEPETPEQEHRGPSWILMLFLIFLAMLVATGFAWLFIHPMLHPH